MKLLIIGGVGFILGWNLFLIQRDDKLYQKYYDTSCNCGKMSVSDEFQYAKLHKSTT